MLKIVRLILTCCLVLKVSSAFAGQRVHVVWPLEAGETHLQVLDQALDYGFNQAVMLETDDILGVKLEDRRREILAGFLAPEVKGLVLSYRELSRKELPEELVLDLEVNVDRERLKSFLKKTGVFFTRTKNWPCDLILKAFNPGERELLSRLRLLTGVVVQADAVTRLVLKRDLQGAWQGEIQYNGQTISQKGMSLEKVWMALWARFFSLPEVQKNFMRKCVLATSGWATTDAIMFFDHVLSGWDKIIETHKIVSVNIDVLAITSKWLVSTVDDARLEQKLSEYLPEQGVVFELKEIY